MDLHDFIEDIAILIDRAPKVTLLTVDRDDDLVRCQMSRHLGAFRFSLWAYSAPVPSDAPAITAQGPYLSHKFFAAIMVSSFILLA